MDKRPVYPGSIPLDLDLLTPQRNTEIALGFVMQAAFGTSTVIDGLAAVPTSPASMQVDVGPGSIIFATTVDTLTSGFGSLPVDNADALVKIGVNLTKTTMSALTAPASAGQSQNWLLECQFIEADGTPVVLPYYNAANPSVPYTGPANAGTTNNTARTNRVQLQWKGGTAATTGTQNTPSPDAGWTGVALVTVANGQSTITSANITPYSGAPYVPTKLSIQRTKLLANLNLYVAATGGSDTANTGLSLSSPFLTLQRAWNALINSYDLNGFSVTINVANGTYSTGLVASGALLGLGSGNSVTFLGNPTTPANVVITTSNAHCLQAVNSAVISVSGFKLQATGTASSGPASGIVAQNISFVNITGAMSFGAVAGADILALQSSVVFNGGVNYAISGGAAQHYSASGCSEIIINPCTITLTGTPAFSGAFAQSLGSSYIQAGGITFSGSATGSRYNATFSGAINTLVGGANYFPGSTAGTTSTGGQYG